jgi:hypothetical protein
LAHGSVDLKGLFNLSLINILWALVGGERFRRDDTRLAHLLDIVDNFVRSADFTRANIPLPDFCLRYFPSLTRKLLGLRNDLFTPLQDFIRVIILVNSVKLLTEGSIKIFWIFNFRKGLGNMPRIVPRIIPEILLTFISRK